MMSLKRLQREKKSGSGGPILNASTQMSFRSFTNAGISSRLRARTTSSAFFLRSNCSRGT